MAVLLSGYCSTGGLKKTPNNMIVIIINVSYNV